MYVHSCPDIVVELHFEGSAKVSAQEEYLGRLSVNYDQVYAFSL